MHVVLAGGGTAGHIEPALALADALRRADPDVGITALGTSRGLENRLVPARGYDLELIPAVPVPRRPSAALLRLPGNLRGAVDAAADAMARVGGDVVVGFGGYVAAPAYLAGRRLRLPLVVHEANARPGMANRLGARLGATVAVAVEGTPLTRAEVIGIPLRRAVSTLDRPARRAEARAELGLDPDAPVVLVFGGSQGARRVNDAVVEALPRLLAAGAAVLHVLGPALIAEAPEAVAGRYVPLDYLEHMEVGYAAADVVVSRSGALTCAELAAVGMPALLVPLPIGNGEQRLNAGPLLAAGAALAVPDAELDAERLLAEIVPLLTDPARLAQMGEAARATGHPDADERLAQIVRSAVAGRRPPDDAPHPAGSVPPDAPPEGSS